MKKKNDLMYELFGKDEEHQCKTCKNLSLYEANRKYYKCSVYGNTNSESTDWRLKWSACGFYNKDYDWIPVIEYKKHMPRKKAETQINGQMTIDELLGGDDE